LSIKPADVIGLVQSADHPLGVRELLKLGGFNAGQQSDLQHLLRELVRQGKLEKVGKRFVAPARPSALARAPTRGPERPRKGGQGRPAPGPRGEQVKGILHVHRDGFGFVHPLTGEGENIFVPPDQVARALDGDRVVVEVVPGRGGRTMGLLVDVTERLRQRAVGVYRQEGRRAWVEPNDRGLRENIQVPPTQLARPGDLVKVLLGIGSAVLEPGEGLHGEVLGSIGRPGEPSGEVLSVAYGQGFSDEFPDEVMAEADQVLPTVRPEEAKQEGRRDLRRLPLVTIDGADARDFDDAVYAEPVTGGGWRLVVAIADVSHYVREGSPLDLEALHRGTSVYLPDRVLPMLPERLSNGICSLRPDEDRLCMVADMKFDAQAALTSHDVYPGVMRSVARCTYEEVQAVLDGEDVPHRNLFRPHFELLMTLARALNAMRKKRGALDFDLPEYKVVLDEDGLPVRLDKRDRKDSHRLVEECMLAANEAVATFFQERKLPSVYRFHDEPNEDKLQVFAELARAHGFELGGRKEISPHDLMRFLEKLEGHPEKRALNQLLLRSMMQAVYSSENVGHYGLGAAHYLHFTSPIRRYPDLLVHRLLKAHWSRGGKVPSESQREAEEARLEALALQSSDRERAAVSVEREVISYYSALLVKDRVGEVFDGVVSSVTDFGLFVELSGVHVEGLLKSEAVGFGAKFEPTLNALSFPDGRRFKVGDTLRIRLANVSIERRQIDLELEGQAQAEAPPAGRGRRGDTEGQPRASSSPHPGYDRLRSLAGKRSGGDGGGGRGGARGRTGKGASEPARDKFGNPKPARAGGGRSAGGSRSGGGRSGGKSGGGKSGGGKSGGKSGGGRRRP
jgi:ribonuclease R